MLEEDEVLTEGYVPNTSQPLYLLLICIPLLRLTWKLFVGALKTMK